MPIKHYFTKISLVFLFIVSCKNEKKGNPHHDHSAHNIILLEKTINKLSDCDLVLRRGRDITSYIFSEINQKDKNFSHCGLVVFEQGYPYVYHAIGGEENPNQELKRDSVKNWLSFKGNQAIGIARFYLNDEQKRQLRKRVHQYYFEKKKFDNHFDLQTDDYFYCSEFVYKTLNKVYGTDTIFKTVTQLGRNYILVENLYHNSKAQPVCQVWFK